jgi:hypothetical protein
MTALYKKILKGQYAKISNKYSNDINEIIKLLLKVNPSERPSCDQILKNKMVMERIDFFKDREGFTDENFDNMDDTQLLKTLRVTKDMLFLSEQLPVANYNIQKKPPEKKVRNINKLKIKDNNFLPNISNKSNYRSTSEGKKIMVSNSSKKILRNYKIIGKQKGDHEISVYNNDTQNTQNNILINTDNNMNIVKKTDNRLITNKDLGKTNNYDLINNSPTYRIYQEKHGSTQSDKNFLKYTKGISLRNLYSIYSREIKKNNNNIVNYNYKSPNKKNVLLPNIYKNKSKKQIKNKSRIKRY